MEIGRYNEKMVCYPWYYTLSENRFFNLSLLKKGGTLRHSFVLNNDETFQVEGCCVFNKILNYYYDLKISETNNYDINGNNDQPLFCCDSFLFFTARTLL